MKKQDFLNGESVNVNIRKLNELAKVHDFRASEIRIIFELIARMTEYNALALNVSSLAESLGLSKSTVSRSLKKMRASGLLIEKKRRITFNPEIAFKDYERAFFPLEHAARHLFGE